jgi:hypothetical protein
MPGGDKDQESALEAVVLERVFGSSGRRHHVWELGPTHALVASTGEYAATRHEQDGDPR